MTRNLNFRKRYHYDDHEISEEASNQRVTYLCYRYDLDLITG